MLEHGYFVPEEGAVRRLVCGGRPVEVGSGERVRLSIVVVDPLEPQFELRDLGTGQLRMFGGQVDNGETVGELVVAVRETEEPVDDHCFRGRVAEILLSRNGRPVAKLRPGDEATIGNAEVILAECVTITSKICPHARNRDCYLFINWTRRD